MLFSVLLLENGIFVLSQGGVFVPFFKPHREVFVCNFKSKYQLEKKKKKERKKKNRILRKDLSAVSGNSCRTKETRLILESGIYISFTNISEGTAFQVFSWYF